MAGTQRLQKLLVTATQCGCANDPVGIATTRSGTPQPDSGAPEVGPDAGGQRMSGRDATAPYGGESDSTALRPDETGTKESDAGGTADARAAGAESGGALTDVFVLTRDAGETPPEHCVAPCIWELIVDCLPTLDECTVEPMLNGGSTLCDSNTGWALREVHPGYRRSSMHVLRAGRSCFSVHFDWLRDTQYTGPQGPVGFGYSGRTYCSTTSILNSTSRELPADAVPYDLTPDAPECAAWGRHGFPVGALNCASETEGECPESEHEARHPADVCFLCPRAEVDEER